MRLYVMTDEISENIINVFLAKNDNVAIKQLEFDLKHNAKQFEIKLYSLDTSLDYDEGLVSFCDNDVMVPRLIYSFPQIESKLEDSVKSEIMREADKEVE